MEFHRTGEHRKSSMESYGIFESEYFRGLLCYSQFPIFDDTNGSTELHRTTGVIKIGKLHVRNISIEFYPIPFSH